jgi:hypothetical protein
MGPDDIDEELQSQCQSGGSSEAISDSRSLQIVDLCMSL